MEAGEQTNVRQKDGHAWGLQQQVGAGGAEAHGLSSHGGQGEQSKRAVRKGAALNLVDDTHLVNAIDCGEDVLSPLPHVGEGKVSAPPFDCLL